MRALAANAFFFLRLLRLRRKHQPDMAVSFCLSYPYMDGDKTEKKEIAVDWDYINNSNNGKQTPFSLGLSSLKRKRRRPPCSKKESSALLFLSILSILRPKAHFPSLLSHSLLLLLYSFFFGQK